MTEFVNHIESIVGKKAISIHIPNILLYPIAFIAEFVSLFTSRSSILNRDKINEFKENYWLVSGEKAEQKLGFVPSENIQENLRKTYIWYKEKGWL